MSNAALRLLMRGATAAVPSGLVREKVNVQTTGTTNTATFTEPTALDSSHLLVALVHCYTTWTTPAGWTVAASGTAGLIDQRILVKQGDGSTNGITVTGVSNSSSVQLLAFSGFVSLTPLATGSGPLNNTNTGGNVTLAGPSTTPAGTGVCLLYVAALGTMQTVRTMGNGYTEVANPVPFGMALFTLSGKKDYTGTGTYSSLVDWSGTVSYFRWLSVVMDLV